MNTDKYIVDTSESRLGLFLSRVLATILIVASIPIRLVLLTVLVAVFLLNAIDSKLPLAVLSAALGYGLYKLLF